MIPGGSRNLLLVQRCGPVAERVLRTDATATVAAIFERSFYIEVAGHFVCLGSPHIGDGPLNAIVTEAALAHAVARLEPGRSIALSPGAGVEPISIDAKRATVWNPPAWPPPTNAFDRRPQLCAVRKFATAHAPSDGLSRMVMAIASGDERLTPLLRIALPRFKMFETWFVNALRQPESSVVPPPVDLLGLGPGLTPSGDDVLGGLMIALDAIGEYALRDRITNAVLATAPAATSPLSAAFLSAAAEGLGSAALHDFLGALVGGSDDETVLTTANALAAIGHTSGWDAMAGAMLALSTTAALEPS